MTVVMIDDSYKCIGFAMRTGHVIPHFCNALLSDKDGIVYQTIHHVDDRARSLTERERDFFKDGHVLLAEEQIKQINDTYKMGPSFKVFYSGSDDCRGNCFGYTPPQFEQFAFGKKEDVVQQIETNLWDRMMRCPQDLVQFQDQMKDIGKKKYLLGLQIKSYEDNYITYYPEYEVLKNKLETLIAVPV